VATAIVVAQTIPLRNGSVQRLARSSVPMTSTNRMILVISLDPSSCMRFLTPDRAHHYKWRAITAFRDPMASLTSISQGILTEIDRERRQNHQQCRAHDAISNEGAEPLSRWISHFQNEAPTSGALPAENFHRVCSMDGH
jgi:hypothetical protein